MKRRMNLWLGVLLAAILVALTLAGCAAPAGSPAATSGGAAAEGIKVHGAWTIEVTNPDGALAERREFQNALTNLGKASLANYLGRQNSLGLWRIYLGGVGDSDAFMDASSGASPGIIVETADLLDSSAYPYVFETLSVSVSGSTVVLSGTATAQRNGLIDYVQTATSRASATQPPGGTGGSYVEFTSTTLATPVGLSTGQQVAVTVVISFS